MSPGSARPTRRCGADGRGLDLVHAGFVGHEGAAVFAVRVTLHSSGTSVTLPDGEVTCATTWASLTSTNAGSTTSAVSLIGFARLDAIDRAS